MKLNQIIKGFKEFERLKEDKLKGIYLLLIKVKKDTSIQIGKLRKIRFDKGNYLYVGSAQNNLRARIKRHFRKNNKTKFWHIDYLLSNKNVKIKKVFYKLAKKEEECKAARLALKYGKPIRGFGCSDCQCRSHLIKI